MEKLETILSQFATLPLFTKLSVIGVGGVLLLALIVRLGTRARGPVSRPPLLGRLAMCATFLGAAALAGTGFAGPLLKDAPVAGGVARMGGLFLIFHMVFAGLFIAGLTGVALFSAESCRLGGGAGEMGAGPRKFFFWCLLALGLATILAALAGMTPLVSSEQVGLLAEVHRWSAAALLMAMIGYLVSR